MKQEVISLKGDRDLWIDFVYRCKKNKKKVWEVLEPFIKKYIRGKTK